MTIEIVRAAWFSQAEGNGGFLDATADITGLDPAKFHLATIALFQRGDNGIAAAFATVDSLTRPGGRIEPLRLPAIGYINNVEAFTFRLSVSRCIAWAIGTVYVFV